jgi:hypothetical protein
MWMKCGGIALGTLLARVNMFCVQLCRRTGGRAATAEKDEVLHTRVPVQGINKKKTNVQNCADMLINVSTLFRNVQKCLEMFRIVQNCSELFRNVQICSEMFIHVQKCSELFRIVQNCSELSRNDQKCSDMFRNVQKCA